MSASNVDLMQEAVAKMNASFVAQKQLYRTVEHVVDDPLEQLACAAHLIRKAENVIVCDKTLDPSFYMRSHGFVAACREVSGRRNSSITLCTEEVPGYAYVDLVDFFLTSSGVALRLSDQIEHPRSIYLSLYHATQTKIGLVWGWEDPVRKEGTGVLSILYSDPEHDGYEDVLGKLFKRSHDLTLTGNRLTQEYLEKSPENRLLLQELAARRQTRAQPAPV